jgi:hypothetical protein
MLKELTRIAGPLQALVGVAGAAAPGAAAALGTGMGGNAVNVISGAVLSYLGYKGSPGAQRSGAQVLGVVNLLVGVLNAAGVHQIAGFPLSEGNVAMAVNLVIGVWGLVAGFTGKK